jgi:two-component system sensor histidine kinase ChvG
VTVEDDGPGIPENKLEKVFERFYSERPVQEEFGNHSGLGLSIVRQIIIAHGGKVFAENRFDTDGRKLGARFITQLKIPKD